MAEVWLARQHGPMGFEKLVAIKRLLPHLQDQDPFVRMFLDEARIAARINHANVVQIFDLGQADEGYFIAMEYLLGESLARLMGEGLKREHPIPELLGAAIVSQMCKGLHHAHTLRDGRGQPLGIVHRDVSPQNVVVQYDGAVKLLDFGIAKARERLAETTTTGVKGKYAYMSPEQCLGEPMDHRSDIFSCGVVLWELLTRRRLYKHQNKLMVLKMITEGHVAPPSRINPSISTEIDEICLRALARNAKDRYQTADLLSLDLDAALTRLGVSAPGAQIAEYLGEVFGDDLERRSQFATLVTMDESAAHETGEHWLDLLPEPTGEIISFSRSPAVATSHGKPLPKVSPTWWIATAVVALLAAVVTLGALLFSAAGASECRLIVESDPGGATVVLDGVTRPQRTPASLERLKAGAHRLSVRLEGHQPWQRDLQLRSGETLRLEATLQKIASGPKPRPVAATSPDRGSPPRAADAGVAGVAGVAALADRGVTRPRPAPARELGTLNLDTAPWATIYYGKRKLGDTPLIGVRLPVGPVSLTAVNPEEKIRTTFTVEIKKGQTLRKRIALKP